MEAGAARVFGLSAPDSGYQRELVDRLRLPFAILSDPKLQLAEALDLPTFEAGGLTLYKSTVINDGVVNHTFYPISRPREHAAQVFEWLRGR